MWRYWDEGTLNWAYLANCSINYWAYVERVNHVFGARLSAMGLSLSERRFDRAFFARARLINIPLEDLFWANAYIFEFPALMLDPLHSAVNLYGHYIKTYLSIQNTLICR